MSSLRMTWKKPATTFFRKYIYAAVISFWAPEKKHTIVGWCGFFSLHWNENVFNLLFILHTIPFFPEYWNLAVEKQEKCIQILLFETCVFSTHFYCCGRSFISFSSNYFKLSMAEMEWMTTFCCFILKHAVVFLRDLIRFIVDLSLCRMQYAINVCYDYFFHFVNSGNVSRLLLLLSLCLSVLCVCVCSRSASSERSATEVKHMHMKIIAARARSCMQHHISMSSQSNSFTFFRGIIIFFHI